MSGNDIFYFYFALRSYILFKKKTIKICLLSFVLLTMKQSNLSILLIAKYLMKKFKIRKLPKQSSRE